MKIIRRGARGDDVRDVQQRLVALGAHLGPTELDATYGPTTEEAVRAFQRERGLPDDGLVGPDTWGQLVEAGWSLGDRVLYLRVPPFRGDDVRGLQRRLNALGFDGGREDGIHGTATDRAVRDFQRNVGREPDGIVGPGTLRALERLRPPLEAPSRAVVREAEDLTRQRGGLQGAVVAIEPGHGPVDPGHTAPGGTVEADATMLLAEDLATELRRRAAVPAPLRAEGEDPEPSARSKAANELDAACCVSLHCHADPDLAGGAACAFFGTKTTHSPAGERLAREILSGLSERADLEARGTRRLAVAILRETWMPAVVVELGLLADAEGERRAGDPEARAAIARGVADGIERFLGAPPRGRLVPDEPA